MSGIILVYCPCGSQKEAEKISEKLVEQNLAVCTNIFPIKSIYKWKGRLQKDDEFVMLVKVPEKKHEQCIEKIKELHSYDVPGIIAIRPSSINKEYLDWATEVN